MKSETTSKKLLPKLRFRDFFNDGAWKETALGTCLMQHPDYGLNAASVPYNENLPTYLRITDISDDGLYIEANKVSVEGDVSIYNYLEEGDIVLARTGASVGKSYKYRREDGILVFAGYLIRIRPDIHKLDSGYLFQFLSTKNYWNWVHATSSRSGQPGINSNEYASLQLPLPPFIQEQQKIAACLSSLDDLITAHKEKLEALKAHKKGLMQQLFPAEGELEPRLRFEEFRGSVEWQAIALGELADVSKLAGYEFTEHIVYENTGSIIALRGLNIKDNKLDLTDVKYIDGSDFSKLSRSKLFINDLMFTYIGTIGEVALINENDKYYLAPNVSRIRVKHNKLTPQYILQFFNSPSFKRGEVNRYISSSSQPALTMENVRKFLIKVPSIQEQLKIAEFLISIDELITNQTDKIAELQKHKKGLTQGLFPNSNT